MITVITPTNRNYEALALVHKALRRQTFRDFEHIVVRREGELPEGCVWTLNRDMNRAIQQARGALIISWQDFTYAKPDTLERFYNHFIQEPKTLVTAVGNKYNDGTWTVATWKDPRMRTDQGTYYPCNFEDIEYNLCAIPRQAIYDVGGWDESLDAYYGMDGYSVSERINLIGGYDFKIDQSIVSYSVEHGRPERWEELNAIHGPYQQIRKGYVENPRLHYL